MAAAVAASAQCGRVAGAAQARPGAAQAAAWRPSTASQRGQAPQGAAALGSAAASRRRRCRRQGAAPVQALFGGLGAVFKNDPSERTRKAYQARVDAINALEPSMQQLSDAQLRELTQALKARAAAGESLDSLLVEAFAVSSSPSPLLARCLAVRARAVLQCRACAQRLPGGGPPPACVRVAGVRAAMPQCPWLAARSRPAAGRALPCWPAPGCSPSRVRLMCRPPGRPCSAGTAPSTPTAREPPLRSWCARPARGCWACAPLTCS